MELVQSTWLYIHGTKLITLNLKNTNKKMCLWNTMPPLVANSNEGKFVDTCTSRKILSQEMTMCNMEALVSYP